MEVIVLTDKGSGWLSICNMEGSCIYLFLFIYFICYLFIYLFFILFFIFGVGVGGGAIFMRWE